MSPIAVLKRYLKNFAVLLDEAGNTITGGDPGETISSRSYKAELAGRPWGCRVCKWLARVFGPDHCKKSYEKWAGADAIVPDGK